MAIKRAHHDIDSGKFRFTMETGGNGLEMLDTLSDVINSMSAAYEQAVEKFGLYGKMPYELRWNGYEWIIK